EHAVRCGTERCSDHAAEIVDLAGDVVGATRRAAESMDPAGLAPDEPMLRSGVGTDACDKAAVADRETRAERLAGQRAKVQQLELRGRDAGTGEAREKRGDKDSDHAESDGGGPETT